MWIISQEVVPASEILDVGRAVGVDVEPTRIPSWGWCGRGCGSGASEGRVRHYHKQEELEHRIGGPRSTGGALCTVDCAAFTCRQAAEHEPDSVTITLHVTSSAAVMTGELLKESHPGFNGHKPL